MGIEHTYRELVREREEALESDPETLNEFRMIRAGTAMVFASRSKQAGDRSVQHAKKGQSHLDRIRKDDPTEKTLDHISEAMDEMFEAIIDQRSQIGNLVGISLASVLISERSGKDLTKILKQALKRR